METQLLKGKPVADAMDQKTIEDVSRLKDAGITPCLAVLRVGEKKDDIAYERSILKRADKLGIAILSKVLPVESGQEAVKQCIISLNEDASVHGILMFLPLPAHLDEKELVETICPNKDMDGVTSISKAGLYSGSHVGYPPCTPDGIMRILEFYGKDVAGKHVAVVGRSLVTGKPMAMMLLEKNATVSICHSRTPDLGAITRQADMVVVCTGHMNTLTAKEMREGQVLLDMGINVDEEGSLKGDINREDAVGTAAAYTPVPGGAGSVTVSVLLSHVIDSAKKSLG